MRIEGLLFVIDPTGANVVEIRRVDPVVIYDAFLHRPPASTVSTFCVVKLRYKSKWDE